MCHRGDDLRTFNDGTLPQPPSDAAWLADFKTGLIFAVAPIEKFLNLREGGGQHVGVPLWV